ncbi:asparagine synthase (glutamine-hydrolyzing) [Tepidimonas taiwanensis]|uniref:asparagine synthase (glutamine-hydrolyzing) n=1 Tax=Tepidimonas taiwanensis TaxID=307486 RepID=A0A554X0C9_9BURK|nr:asparagine synthase (glutamine-hydrolyzing) [Tepidimonas taiwanensis]TSE29270.1 Asparagine synthetase glutamine-hydrolyzing 1 [Tepidimonas taiwanensis]UBQ06156.1 asparagine synthase (glutamine-hydrolyzing) [Tepidimonas taiwanensis]
MCGLTGFWEPGGCAQEDATATVRRMADTLVHRGPDDAGVWVDAAAGVALGHRRLAILDLSPAGHQPMVSASGRYVIAFNGEIYNHLELRAALEKIGAGGTAPPGWRGHADTETLLAAIEAWGVEETLQRCVGMFAFALWDRQTRTLTLARDRMGEKPLYYGWQRGVWLFGSELKALRAHPAFAGEVDRGALALFFCHNAVPAPYSIYRDIRKLPPGTYLSLTEPQARAGAWPEPVAYWSLAEVVATGQRTPFAGAEAEAVGELERLLRQAVAGQMLADVPLGAFLSGGIDSSTVVALMQAQLSRPVRTFSIGFFEAGYNEAQHAAAVARYLGTDHTELYVTPEQAMAVIPKLPALYDEPFADSSQIPTFLVAQLARQHVTVALSGDGGDELFGGYTRYFLAHGIWQRLAWMPRGMRAVLARGLAAASPAAWDRFAAVLYPLLPRRLRFANPGDKLHKLARILLSNAPEAVYHALVSHWTERDGLVLGAQEPPTVLTQPETWPTVDDFRHRMMALDAVSYLPDDILVKVDRAAMGVSLETRVPLLDHRVVEFAWRLPLSMKIREGQGKWLLRQVLYKYVPKELIERPKMGFGVPIDDWLRGPLREWAEDLLDERRLREEGFIDPAPVRQKWREHLSGQRNWQYHLWDVLMWEAWWRGECDHAQANRTP